MAYFSVSGIEIKDIAAAVPANTVDNAELDILNERDRHIFIEKTGIRKRRVAPLGLCASDLCLAATEQIFGSGAYAAKDFEALVFVTQSPDHPLPGNCAHIQNRLGFDNSTFMLDVNQGCAGYVYGLATLSCMMQSTGAKRGLLLVGDTITRWLCQSDSSTIPIFSDAGTATVLERTGMDKTMHFNLGNDGKGADLIKVAQGAARYPYQPYADKDVTSPFLEMKGLDVVNYSFRYVRPNVEELFDLSGWRKEATDYFVFHQANKILNDSLQAMLKIPREKAPQSLGTYGNTSCATIPLTVIHALGTDLEQETRRLMLSGFGVGFSWGSALMEVGPIPHHRILEIDTCYDGS